MGFARLNQCMKVCVLKGMPAQHMAATMAHELAHVYLWLAGVSHVNATCVYCLRQPCTPTSCTATVTLWHLPLQCHCSQVILHCAEMCHYSKLWDYSKMCHYSGMWDYSKMWHYSKLWNYSKMWYYSGVWDYSENCNHRLRYEMENEHCREWAAINIGRYCSLIICLVLQLLYNLYLNLYSLDLDSL